MSNNNIKAKKIGVDCLENDPVDIKCGGPLYLGFDFYVEENKCGETAKYIIQTLNQLKIPFISIYTDEETYNLKEEELWSKERIRETIEEEKDFLIQESKREHVGRKK